MCALGEGLHGHFSLASGPWTEDGDDLSRAQSRGPLILGSRAVKMLGGSAGRDERAFRGQLGMLSAQMTDSQSMIPLTDAIALNNDIQRRCLSNHGRTTRIPLTDNSGLGTTQETGENT